MAKSIRMPEQQNGQLELGMYKRTRCFIVEREDNGQNEYDSFKEMMWRLFTRKRKKRRKKRGKGREDYKREMAGVEIGVDNSCKAIGHDRTI
jgi:hypothetical protein